MSVKLDILYEDNHLLVVNKTAGIATMGAESGPTLHALAADYLKQKYHKPGKAFVGVVSRLDTMTSGVIVLARTSKAASRLVPQFGETTPGSKARQFDRAVKLYLAALQGELDTESGTLVDRLRKDDAARRMRIVPDDSKDGQEAVLDYLTVGKSGGVTIVAVRLRTGRKHQIRVQFADRGHPLLGDRKYGSRRRFTCGVALHSWRLQITHPTRNEKLWWEAELPDSWGRLVEALPVHRDLLTRVNRFFDLSNDETT